MIVCIERMLQGNEMSSVYEKKLCSVLFNLSYALPLFKYKTFKSAYNPEQLSRFLSYCL